ncbi:MAG TPA: exodeoxyribonuclease V subunit gamma, partial [Frankiaceae bacterium]|nr:exodeoxyribonuclease V subunit gamma [Frankiaceae bacterium]
MLHLHRAERADRLAAGLAAVMRHGLDDPFAQELIAVPAKGVERWLTQRLAHSSDPSGGEAGVCANVRFISSRTLIDEVSAAVVEDEDDAWSSSRMLFGLLALGEVAGWRLPPERPVAAAADLAQLFAAYQTQRPDLVRAWAAGEDGDLAEDLRWQPSVWRQLRARTGTSSPAERLDDVCRRLRDDAAAVDLPERLSVFGPTRLTRDQIAVLAALARHRDVHLWLPHPSPALWDAVAEQAEKNVSVHRRLDRTGALPRHPLLASLGRDSRELQLLLAGADTPTEQHHHAATTRPSSLLGRLQADLAADQPSAPLPLDHGDRSLQVHACHGPARQVEVLREVLLGLLEDDPTLEPRDVLVMCPDIEAYAPLISAAFGLVEEGADQHTAHHPGHRLRVRLADRSLRQTNPLLAAVAQLLELADGRVTASQVLDLAASAPVRRRFRLDDEDLELLRDWVARTGVRWGLDAQHRAPFRLDKVPQNTWETGLDRLLLGASLSEGLSEGGGVRWLGTALPLDDVDSNDVDLAGRLSELLDRLADVLGRLQGRQPLTGWFTTLTDALDQLCATSARDAWQQAQARRELADVAEGADQLADTLDLSLDDLRALLADRLRGRPTRANFRTGNLTMCSMVPMRSVPHRVICLLGLDDGAFPRNVIVNGDDLLARDPMVGERDARSEDRQLLLDAVLAAEDTLVVLYTGADERTNSRRPAAVPVGEILDAVDRMVTAVEGQRGRDQVVVRHPLQPFDPRNFTAAALSGDGLFSFDRPALEGARAALIDRQPPAAFLPAPLPRTSSDTVELDSLIRFLEHPVRGFLRQRLELSIAQDEEEIADELTVELDALTKWQIGDRLLGDLLRGADLAAVRQAEWRRGVLPPSAIGNRILDEVLREVAPLLTASHDLRQPEARTVDVAIALPDGRRLGGTVSSVHDTAVVRVTYSRLGAKQRLRAWAQVLALSAGQPDQDWRAVTIGKARSNSGYQRSTLGPVAPDEARRLLGELVDLHDRGLREPLPLAVKTSARYASQRKRKRPVDVASRDADRDWTSGKFPGEQAEREHEIAWGTEPPLDVLLAAPPTADEAGWFDEPSRFG